MILYGGLVNNFRLLTGGIPFQRFYGVKRTLSPVVEQEQEWPIYGPVVNRRIAPSKFTIFGASLEVHKAPDNLLVWGPIRNNYMLGVNISGLSISDIAVSMVFDIPSYVYNIYPYRASDIKEITGTTNDYIIGDNQVVFTVMPTGPIKIIPYNRLQIYSNEIKRLTVTNTIAAKAEFTNITVSGDFLFSLNQTGPWTNSLLVTDMFYVKGPDLPVDGSSYDKLFTLTATFIPRG